MSTGTFLPPSEDDAVAAAICEYITAREAGRPIAQADWLARYPGQAVELRQYLDESDGVKPLLQMIGRGGLRRPDLQSDERFIGDYELLHCIGGNMGVVYLARQLSLPREVAVKLLLRPGEKDQERFRAEAEAMARLNHPHIASIIDVSRAAGVPFFSMEWYPRGSLDKQLTDTVANPSRAAELVEQVACAVHHAHVRGVLHRDLKPANIVLDEANRPFVADFGLAILLSDRELEGRAGAGTPAYMAPEQLTGDVTVATDVHGLGAVLYALLTGRPPFGADSLSELLEQVRTSDPASPRELNPRVDVDLAAICRKCLKKAPSERYATAAAVADDLERFRKGQFVRARELGAMGQAMHVLRQAREATDFRTLSPALMALALLALLTNLTAFGLLRSGAAEPWVWAAVFASYVPLFAFLVRDVRTAPDRNHAGRRHLWTIWLSHATACLAVFVAFRVTAGDDFAQGIAAGYVACAGLNAMSFAIMGSLFAGRLYLLGAAWLVATLAMAVALPWAVLIYAVLIGLCSLITGLQLRGLMDGQEPDCASYGKTWKPRKWRGADDMIATDQPPPNECEIDRRLGFWGLWALGVGAVVGDGIFVMLGQGIEKAGPSAFLAFLVAGIFQMFLMIALGELAVGMPNAGAMSVWVGRLMGDWWGFLAGFSFALGWVFAGGSVGLAIGQITASFFFSSPEPTWTIVFAIGFLTLFALLNALGADLAVRTQLVLVLALVGLMAAFAIIGAGSVRSENFTPLMPHGWNGFWLAVPLGTYAYLGAITLTTAGGECRNPRDLPRALFWSSVTFLVLYTAAQAVVEGIVPTSEVTSGTLPFTIAAERLFGHYGGLALSLAAWLAAATTLLMGTIFAPSRIFYSQARAGYLPAALGRVHPRTRTPVLGIAIVWAASVGLVLLGSRDPNWYYEALGLQLVFAWMVSWALALLAAVLYRRRFPDEVGRLPWRQPLYPLFPILGFVGIVVVTWYTLADVPATLAVGLGWMSLLAAYYWLRVRRRVRNANKSEAT